MYIVQGWVIHILLSHCDNVKSVTTLKLWQRYMYCHSVTTLRSFPHHIDYSHQFVFPNSAHYFSNLCRIFLLRRSAKCFGAVQFSRVGTNFTIGQRPKISSNFSKICMKINKNLKNYWDNLRKMQNFAIILVFLGGGSGAPRM